MNQAHCTTSGLQHKLLETITFAKQILLDPAAAFRNMARHGGFIEPLLFMASVGAIAGLLKILVTFYYMINGAAIPLLTALSAVITVPLTVIIFCYLGAFLLSVVMKHLGCDADLETAFRVTAYLSVISPLAVIATAIPYIGNLLVFGLLAYLLVTAAIEVYQLNSNTAWMTFGLTIAVLALLATGTEFRNRLDSTDAQQPAVMVDVVHPTATTQ